MTAGALAAWHFDIQTILVFYPGILDGSGVVEVFSVQGHPASRGEVLGEARLFEKVLDEGRYRL